MITAYHVGATFFNTRVNVSNMEQRILTLMMMGFSYADIYQHVLNREKKKNSINGFPPDLTLAGLEKYKHKYGVTPTLVTLSQPHTINESEGLKDKIKSTEKPGDRIEIDCFEYEFNESRTKSTKHSKKLTSFGGAIAAVVCVDVDSGFIFGQLIDTFSNSISYVKQFHQQIVRDSHIVSRLGADTGVITESVFRVYSPTVETYCLENKIIPILSESENHKK